MNAAQAFVDQHIWDVATLCVGVMLGVIISHDTARVIALTILAWLVGISCIIGFVWFLVWSKDKQDDQRAKLERNRCEASGGTVRPVPETKREFVCVREMKNCKDINTNARCVIPWEDN